MTSARPGTSATTSSRHSWSPDRDTLGRRILVVLVALLALTSCTGAAPAGADRSVYDAGLWPERPVVDLAVDVSDDLRRATGRETVTFTPDLPVCELVFRAWPNNPTISSTGGSLRVDGASVDGRTVRPRFEAAGARPGAMATLIELPLPQCVPAGRVVRAELAYTLTLGVGADERIGTDPGTRTAWFGSGYPLLAWERGRGWARDPAVEMNGETATSEDAQLSLAVTASEGLVVTGTGSATGSTPAGSGRTVHRFAAPAVRDVTVGVGEYDVREQDVRGVRVHLATPRAGTKVRPERWLTSIDRALRSLPPVFGPYPYPDLWVTVTPGQSDGTEFPTALQFGDVDEDTLDGLVVHEIGHQWFYGLVGDNQARDPWIDESFATFGETVAGTASYDLDDIGDRAAGKMGEPMSYWPDHGGFRVYSKAAYDQGAAVLSEARRRIGAERFDPLLQAYVRDRAHRVAVPADVARAFAGEPQVIDLLTRAGALSSPAG